MPEGVVKLLQQLSPFKAAGPDGITPYVLKTAAEEIAPALTIIFQKSLDTGTVPLDWLCANITPIFKKGDRTSPANYRSVNLTSVCSKILEHILHTKYNESFGFTQNPLSTATWIPEKSLM